MPYLHYEESKTQARTRMSIKHSMASFETQIGFNQRSDGKKWSLLHRFTDGSSTRSSNKDDDSELESDCNSDCSQADMEMVDDYLVSDVTPDRSLIRGYLHNDPPLHIRRSLDQFHCIGMPDNALAALDVDQTVYKYLKRTARRYRRATEQLDAQSLVLAALDVDQTVYKYPKRKTTARRYIRATEQIDAGQPAGMKRCPEYEELARRWENRKPTPDEHHIIIVDQLWLWIIDNGKLLHQPSGHVHLIEK